MTTWTDSIPGKQPRVFIVAKWQVRAQQMAEERGILYGQWTYVQSYASGTQLHGLTRAHIIITTPELNPSVRVQLSQLYALCPEITWEGHERLGIHKTT